jgi:hypothetical protein
MTNAPTLKALIAVLFVFLLGVSVTAIGEAIGHESPASVSAPATSPYDQAETPEDRAAHNRNEAAQSARPGHNH